MVVCHDELFFEPVHVLSRLLSCRPCTTIVTGLSPSLCWLAKSLSAWIKWSHFPCGAASARNTFASRRSVLSCMAKILFAAFQWYRSPKAAHHQLHCFFPCPDEIHQMQVFKRESVTMRAYVRQGDPSRFFDWYNDPPQEVLPQNILGNTQSAVVFLLH